MCPHGNLDNIGGQHQEGMMSADTFERVLLHLQKTGYLSEYLDSYTWGEPLLNPEVGEILETCHDNGVKPVVSTNLSLSSDKVEPLIKHGAELLLVTVSGPLPAPRSLSARLLVRPIPPI
jgi:MoaA/NifB/PqqE/SkfB family radical SAM enzyme